MPGNSDPRQRSVKFDLWPEADRRSWALATAPGDILEPGGGGAGWAPSTKRKYARDYGRWLTWWNTHGTGNPNAPLSARVTPAAFQAYVGELQHLNKYSTVIVQIMNLSSVVQVMAPDDDWSWMRAPIRRLQRLNPRPVNKMSRLVPSRDLLNLGVRLMVEAEAEAQAAEIKPWRVAEHFRNGLMIALLAARPVRRRNFVSIEIGRHLVHVGSGYALRFEAHETKTKRALEFPFPTDLVPRLERYLEVHRPILRACGNKQILEKRRRDPGNSLWVSTTGTTLGQGGIAEVIIDLTTAEFGKQINMHMFRDCAATSIAIEDPEHVQITAAVLGHSSLKTSEKFYNHAKALAAAEIYQDKIEAIRKRVREAGLTTARHSLSAAIEGA